MKVDKIVGPGIFMCNGKKIVLGSCIDMTPAQRILIIADGSADAVLVAADLLSQAEHDEYASSVLITDSWRLAEAVDKEVRTQLARLKRREIARKSVDNYGAIIIVRDMKDAAEISNLIAPEHLEVMTKNPEKILPMIRNAGAIFLGEWTPEALGDYSAGPNHTLPTGGTARFSSPLGVYDFVKRSSLLGFKKEGFSKLAKTVKLIADSEGLEAHGNTIRVREGLISNLNKKGIRS
jgi:histidinol dehydrogenase